VEYFAGFQQIVSISLRFQMRPSPQPAAERECANIIAGSPKITYQEHAYATTGTAARATGPFTLEDPAAWILPNEPRTINRKPDRDFIPGAAAKAKIGPGQKKFLELTRWLLHAERRSKA
jgi:hypothetical protein